MIGVFLCVCVCVFIGLRDELDEVEGKINTLFRKVCTSAVD